MYIEEAKRVAPANNLTMIARKKWKVTEVQNWQGPDFFPGVDGQARKGDDPGPLADQQDKYGGCHLTKA